jgi:hypothetical protein
LSSSTPFENILGISPSITVEELIKNAESPSFSMKKRVFGLNSTDKGKDFNATDDLNNKVNGKDDDDDVSVSVGSPRIYVSPDQLDGSEDIRRRVGWQADNTLSDDSNSPARKEDAAGKKQRTAVAVLKPPNFGGGSNRNSNNLGGEGRLVFISLLISSWTISFNYSSNYYIRREEWDENRNPVDYNEIPHGSIRTFFELVNRSKARFILRFTILIFPLCYMLKQILLFIQIWIRIIETKEEEEPIYLEEDNAMKEMSKSWDSRPRAYVKYACLEATSDRDKKFLYSRWVKYDDAVILLRQLEQNMLEDREATFKFRQECEKYGILQEPRRDESSDDESPFFGGQVNWM